ncbi:MAG: hypothetical protein QGH40_05680 [bacterium]|jgi:hypothetical protein|nr:hypothetical protein [bacterium]
MGFGKYKRTLKLILFWMALFSCLFLVIFIILALCLEGEIIIPFIYAFY